MNKMNNNQGKTNKDSKIKYCKVSNEKRNSLVRLVNIHGQSIKEAAQVLDINYSTARSVMKNFNSKGIIEQKSKGGSNVVKLKTEIMDLIEEIISNNPQLTLKEIKQCIEQKKEGYEISLSSINRGLRLIGIILKQRDRESDKVNAPINIKLRKDYSLWFNNYFINDYSKLIFVNETSFHLYTQRLNEESKKKHIVSRIKGRSVSLLASMSMEKICYCKTIANSNVNDETFNQYLFELCTHMKDNLQIEQGIIIFDDDRINQNIDIENIITNFNYQYRFLPSCSFMLNPIDNIFTKIKNIIRAKLKDDTSDGLLIDIISEEVGKITSTECSKYFQNMLINIEKCAKENPYVHN